MRIKNLIIVEGTDEDTSYKIWLKINKEMDKQSLPFIFDKEIYKNEDVYGSHIDNIYELDKYDTDCIVKNSFIGNYVDSQMDNGFTSLSINEIKFLLQRCNKFFDNVYIIFCKGKNTKAQFLQDDIEDIIKNMLKDNPRKMSSVQIFDYDGKQLDFVNRFCDKIKEDSIVFGA